MCELVAYVHVLEVALSNFDVRFLEYFRHDNDDIHDGNCHDVDIVLDRDDGGGGGDGDDGSGNDDEYGHEAALIVRRMIPGLQK